MAILTSNRIFMLSKNQIYLVSKSISRQALLKESHIPFTVLDQDIQELEINPNVSLEENVKKIALSKIEQVSFESGYEGEIRFVLTADTLGQDRNKIILGKPKDYDHAVSMLKNTHQQINICTTAFCVDKRIYTTNQWVVLKREVRSVSSEYIFHVPDQYIDFYIKNSNALKASGAITIEGIGMQFLKYINGSYSAVLGLPLFQLREVLESLGFF